MSFPVFPPVGFLQTEAPYDIAGRTTVVYICLARAKVAPHVEAVILCRAYCWRRAFFLTSRACAVHWSLASSQTPRTRMSSAGVLMTALRFRFACKLNLVR